jgi:demethoxyubiquinone hydroxylase (CLK1/Coq7/Cat5 family)
LWQIYYGTTDSPLADAAVKKDHEAVEGINKQLEELNEQRRALRNTLNYTSVDEPDALNNDVDSDAESLPSDSTVHRANDSIYLLA